MELSDVLKFISKASISDLQVMEQAINERHRQIERQYQAMEEPARSIDLGSKVRIENASPEYLIGLEGTVEGIDCVRKRVSIQLTPESTKQLSQVKHSGYLVLKDEQYFMLDDVPLEACIPISGWRNRRYEQRRSRRL